jgi:NADH dehydrogenase [ubiquinone] 1 alpha subcomplex assembly factor 7
VDQDGLKALLGSRAGLSVAEFMAWCLTEGKGAYYRAADPIGQSGDFITAPEVSQIFGELIGLWAGAVWQSMGQPAPIQLIELGPGRGTLIVDALRALRVLPEFLAAMELHFVERSERLRERQRHAIVGRFAPVWHESLADIPDAPAIIIANEFFDALPVTQYVHSGGTWRERVVRLGEGGQPVFAAGDAVALPELPAAASEPEEGEILETRPSALPVIEAIGRRARRFPTAALIVDYGYSGDAYGDTLQAVRAHNYADPLTAPGESDLSAHVNFAELARMAEGCGLTAYGPMPQGHFLLALGLETRLRKLLASPLDELARQNLVLGSRRLIDPQQMGELFKAMALVSPGVPAPPPFGMAGAESNRQQEPS